MDSYFFYFILFYLKVSFSEHRRQAHIRQQSASLSKCFSSIMPLFFTLHISMFARQKLLHKRFIDGHSSKEKTLNCLRQKQKYSTKTLAFRFL